MIHVFCRAAPHAQCPSIEPSAARPRPWHFTECHGLVICASGREARSLLLYSNLSANVSSLPAVFE
jgi:hypothetical protein